METKAEYPEIVACVQKIARVFGFDDDMQTIKIWTDTINASCIPSAMLEQRTSELLATWDKQTHYGRPTPADLLQGYQNDSGEYTGEQVGFVIGRMVAERLADEEDQLQTLRSEIHNIVVKRIFEPILENGQIKTKNGHRLFQLTDTGKLYASEIKQRIAPKADKRLVIERMNYYERFRNMRYVDACRELKNADDLLFRPFVVRNL